MPERHAGEDYEIHSLLGYVLNLLGRYREAIQSYKKCIRIAEVKLTNRDLGAALANLGKPYMELEEYDSALAIFNKLYTFELAHGNPLLNAGLLSSLGRVYSALGQPDTAYYFMHTGLRAARTMHVPYAITYSVSTLGHYHLLHQRADSALYYGRILLRQVNKSASPDMENTLFIMANAHGKLKRYDSSYYYYSRYLVYHDSVFQVKQIQQIAALEAQFKLREKQQEISRLETEKKAEVVKRNALAAGLALTVIIAVLMYVYLRSRVRARKREIEIKNWQIEQFTRKMVEKSALAENLRTQLEHLKSDITVPRERIENLSQILNSPILTDDDWNQFKALFEQVHRNFFATLKLKYPTLTQAETRLAALLRLNLTTREMADMLGISADSANKARYRLRKKLELHPEQDLQEIFEQAPPDGNKE
jgi:tetratricopeptide (TPR) repeat protein